MLGRRISCQHFAGMGALGEPMARRYSIIDSQYASQRRWLKPCSGFQSSAKVCPPFSAHGQSTRWYSVVAELWISLDPKYSRQVSAPQRRIAISIGEISD